MTECFVEIKIKPKVVFFLLIYTTITVLEVLWKKILISSLLPDPDLVEELRQKLDNLTAQVNAMGNGYTHF